MDLLWLVQKTMSEEPDRMLLAGRCVQDGQYFTVYPKPDDEGFAFVLGAADVVEGPIDVEFDLEPTIQGGIQALKVKEGARLVVRSRGDEREVILKPEQGREGLLALADPPAKGTCCRILAEFDCATGVYRGWCFGWWNCLFPESKC